MRIFVGSSQEAVDRGTVTRLAVWLEELKQEPIPRNKPGVFLPGQHTFPQILRLSKDVDAAILVFSEDDKTWHRGDLVNQVRDNVLIEYGVFAAARGMERAIIARDREPKTPRISRGSSI
jgi:predicted nucleotide-binding protein